MVASIDLTEFADRVSIARDDGCPMALATASHGAPDISLRGSLMVWDRDHLAFWERSFLESYAALQRNPKVAVFYHCPPRNERQLRCYGEASRSRIRSCGSASGGASWKARSTATPRRRAWRS